MKAFTISSEATVYIGQIVEPTHVTNLGGISQACSYHSSTVNGKIVIMMHQINTLSTYQSSNAAEQAASLGLRLDIMALSYDRHSVAKHHIVVPVWKEEFEYQRK